MSWPRVPWLEDAVFPGNPRPTARISTARRSPSNPVLRHTGPHGPGESGPFLWGDRTAVCEIAVKGDGIALTRCRIESTVETNTVPSEWITLGQHNRNFDVMTSDGTQLPILMALGNSYFGPWPEGLAIARAAANFNDSARATNRPTARVRVKYAIASGDGFWIGQLHKMLVSGRAEPALVQDLDRVTDLTERPQPSGRPPSTLIVCTSFTICFLL